MSSRDSHTNNPNLLLEGKGRPLQSCTRIGDLDQATFFSFISRTNWKRLLAFDAFTFRAQEEKKKRQEERKRKKQESFNKQQVRRSESEALAAYNKNKQIWNEAHPEEIEEEEPCIPLPTPLFFPPKKPEPLPLDLVLSAKARRRCAAACSLRLATVCHCAIAEP